jgi:excisionase family DNA binding protein
MRWTSCIRDVTLRPTMTWTKTPGNRVERVTITVEEAARQLGISRGSAYAAARRGELPAIRLNRRIVVPRVAFQRWLESAGSGEPAAGERAPSAVLGRDHGGLTPSQAVKGWGATAAPQTAITGRVVRRGDAARPRLAGTPTRAPRARSRGDVPGQGSPDRYPDGDADRVADR